MYVYATCILLEAQSKNQCMLFTKQRCFSLNFRYFPIKKFFLPSDIGYRKGKHDCHDGRESFLCTASVALTTVGYVAYAFIFYHR